LIVMRNYLLTKKERKILESYIYRGIKLDGFAVVITRIRKQKDTIAKDVMLMIRTLTQLRYEKEGRKSKKAYRSPSR
jgi:hypothetical protein